MDVEAIAISCPIHLVVLASKSMLMPISNGMSLPIVRLHLQFGGVKDIHFDIAHDCISKLWKLDLFQSHVAAGFEATHGCGSALCCAFDWDCANRQACLSDQCVRTA